MTVIGQEVTRIVLPLQQSFPESHHGSFTLTDTGTQTCIKKVAMDVIGIVPTSARNGLLLYQPIPRFHCKLLEKSSRHHEPSHWLQIIQFIWSRESTFIGIVLWSQGPGLEVRKLKLPITCGWRERCNLGAQKPYCFIVCCVNVNNNPPYGMSPLCDEGHDRLRSISLYRQNFKAEILSSFDSWIEIGKILGVEKWGRYNGDQY